MLHTATCAKDLLAISLLRYAMFFISAAAALMLMQRRLMLLLLPRLLLRCCLIISPRQDSRFEARRLRFDMVAAADTTIISLSRRAAVDYALFSPCCYRATYAGAPACHFAMPCHNGIMNTRDIFYYFPLAMIFPPPYDDAATTRHHYCH